MKTALAVSLFLVLVGCQGNTVGLACSADSDCDKGQSCYTNGFPGGMCTKGCGNDIECPNGTFCAILESDISIQVCAVACTSTDETGCRGGQYTCKAVTATDKRACYP